MAPVNIGALGLELLWMSELGAWMFLQKKQAARSSENSSVLRAALVAKLGFLLFLRGERLGGGGGLGGALLELVHAASGINELLLARVKRMAGVANTDDDGLLGGTGFDHVAAGATDFRVHIFGMNVRLHKNGRTDYQARSR